MHQYGVQLRHSGSKYLAEFYPFLSDPYSVRVDSVTKNFCFVRHLLFVVEVILQHPISTSSVRERTC